MGIERLREAVYEDAGYGGFPKWMVRRTVDQVFKHIRTALSRGEVVRFPGFGTFRVVTLPACTKTLPDGKVMKVPKRKTVRFTAGRWLKEDVNRQ